MTILENIQERSGGKCELCGAEENLDAFVVEPKPADHPDHVAHLCDTCRNQITDPASIDVNHWRCLNDSMWSQVPAVQVLAYRMLSALRGEGWPADLLDMLYLDDNLIGWAKEGMVADTDENNLTYKDCNGTKLSQGDNVTIIKDLKVKGGGFTAKRGTMVRAITLDPNDDKQIEGRVNGQQIVIYTKFVKKA